MSNLLEIAKTLVSDAKVASSAEDLDNSAKIVCDNIQNLVMMTHSIEATEKMGHLPVGTTSKARKIILDLLVEQSKDTDEAKFKLQRILNG